MKAIQLTKFGGPEVLKLKEVEESEPNELEVRITLHAAGVNPVETYIRQGGPGRTNPDVPYTPGTDGAGVVDKVGSKVTRFKQGDRVFVSASIADRQTGSYAEKMVSDESCVYLLPDDLSFHEGAALGVPAFAAYRSLFQRATIRPAETVLVHGASGGVGLLAIQMAKYLGATVIGTAGSKKGEELIKKHGADFVLNHHEENHLDQLSSFLGENEVDVILEMLANVNLETDLKHVSKNSRVIVVGSKGSLDFHPRLLMDTEANVMGMSIALASKKEFAQMMEGLLAMLRSGVVKPYIGKIYALNQAKEAHEEVTNGDSNGMVILDMTL